MEPVQPKSHSNPNKKRNIIALVTLSLVGLSVLLFTLISNKEPVTIRSKADGATLVNMEFSPSTITKSVNDEFTTTIKAMPTVRFFTQGYSFGLNFDKAKLEVTDITYKLGTLSAGIGDSNTTLTKVNTDGYIKINGEIQSATGTLLEASTAAEVVSLKLKVKATGGSGVSLATITAPYFGKVETTGAITQITATLVPLAVNGGGSTTPGVSPSVNPSISVSPQPTGTNDPTFNFKLKFQGINKKPADKYNSIPVKISAVDGTGVKIEGSGTFTADDAGVWTGKVSFKGLKTGTGFYFLVKGPKHIQKRICTLAPTEQYPGSYRCRGQERITLAADSVPDFSKIYLLTGDLPNQDGLVDSYDLSLIRNNIGKTDDNVIKLADLNFDGIVDTQDHSLIIAALSIAYDEE